MHLTYAFVSLSQGPYALGSKHGAYVSTQMPRVDVGRVISPESKAPTSGVGTLVREFLNPFLHDSLLGLAWPSLPCLTLPCEPCVARTKLPLQKYNVRCRQQMTSVNLIMKFQS